MNTTQRSLIAIVAAIIITLIVYWSIPIYLIEPRGIVLPSDGYKTPTTNTIALYDELNAPFDAKTIGILNLMYYTESNDTKAREIFSNAVTKLVQTAGGNALQVIQSFYVPPGSPSGGVSILKGKVILTK